MAKEYLKNLLCSDENTAKKWGWGAFRANIIRLVKGFSPKQ